MSIENEEGVKVIRKRDKLLVQANLSITWKKAVLVATVLVIVLIVWFSSMGTDIREFVVEILLGLLKIAIDDR